MVKSEKGQATVELAFSLVILMIFIFGIIDFGRIYHVYLTLNHASEEAARIASLGGTDTDIIQAAKMTAPTLTSSEMTISISPTNRTSGTYVTINLSYPVSFSIPLLDSSSGPLKLNAKTVMRVE